MVDNAEEADILCGAAQLIGNFIDSLLKIAKGDLNMVSLLDVSYGYVVLGVDTL
jgi:hypothetical protein